MKLGKGDRWLEANDLAVPVQRRARKRPSGLTHDHLPRLSLWDYAIGFWRIPKVTWYVHQVSSFLFVILFAEVFFRPLCGSLGLDHYAFFAWVGSLVVQEAYEFRRAVIACESYFSDGFNWLDIMLIMLLTAASLIRVLVAVEAVPVESVPQVGWIDLVKGVNATMGLSGYPLDRWPLSDECGQDLLIDVQRSLLGVSSILLAARQLEVFYLGRKTGVLRGELERMTAPPPLPFLTCSHSHGSALTSLCLHRCCSSPPCRALGMSSAVACPCSCSQLALGPPSTSVPQTSIKAPSSNSVYRARCGRSLRIRSISRPVGRS